ncbi:MAG TPA: hypothetical protein VGK99_09645 [Acidobacteriota bacterium]
MAANLSPATPMSLGQKHQCAETGTLTTKLIDLGFNLLIVLAMLSHQNLSSRYVRTVNKATEGSGLQNSFFAHLKAASSFKIHPKNEF